MIQRYSRPQMAALWSNEARLRRWRDVELAALEGMVVAGIAPKEALEACRSKAGDFNAEDVAKVDEIEKTTKHDVIAFLTFMEERIGPEARWLHYGMTSSDVLDTSLALILRDASDLMLTGVDRCLEARKPCSSSKRVADTHGVEA